jgi:hypothetical protein
MKFRVTMKDPDTLHDAIKDAVKLELGEVALEEDERDAVAEMRRARVAEVCSRWFKYSEYITVEIDTDAGTCTVVEAEGWS